VLFWSDSVKKKILLAVVLVALVLFGYVAGIISKLINPTYMQNFGEKWYVLVFYVINFIMVFADLLLYFRNRKLDNLSV
jgi:hypothetical protein